MDFKTVKPEELCDHILIGYVTKLLKNEAAFPEMDFFEINVEKISNFR